MKSYPIVVDVMYWSIKMMPVCPYSALSYQFTDGPAITPLISD